jgi:cell wall-associated NlpC family hydrolase
MWRSRALVIVALVLIAGGVWVGTLWNRDVRELNRYVASMSGRHVPDTREDIASFQIDHGIFRHHLTGETSHPALWKDLHDSIPVFWRHVTLDVALLPDSTVFGRTSGMVSVAVGNLRRDPRHGSELVDQAILGTRLTILRERRGWYQVKTEWNYIGWMTGSSIAFRDSLPAPDVRVRVNLAAIRESADAASALRLQAPFGATFETVARGGGYREIRLPDASTAFVSERDIEPIPVPAPAPDGSRLVATAARFQGLPYLWGGNSSSGFDCSGFTQTVFREQGILLPRDANMQIRLGADVDTTGNFMQVQAGDLLYFGPNPDRITHVALSLGGGRIIHASDYVQINSLNPSDPDFAPDRLRTLQAVKRLR